MRLQRSLGLPFFVAFACLSFAQDTASITGTVDDASGAAIQTASVTVSNPANGFISTTVTNSQGEYFVGSVPSGTYLVFVSAPGFGKYEARHVILRVAQKARLDVELRIQGVSTEVVVHGEGMTNVETQSSEIAATVTAKELTQLLLNGRNFTQLVTLLPGVLDQTGQDEGVVGISGNVQYSINGGRTEYNNWEIDGGDIIDNGSNSTLNVYPSLEAIAEVRVLTSNYSAQYGRNASGTIEVETKSGTNQFHGVAYEFVRNEMFNARNYFDDHTQPRAGYKKNDFGFTIGGPILKNKLFFFWSQEWRIERVPTIFSLPVPSEGNRSGDFNDVCAGGEQCPVIPGTKNNYPGNLVPVDQNARALLEMIPAPNATVGGVPYFKASPSQPTNWREELVRGDYNLNSKVRLMGRYIHDSWNTLSPTVVPWNGQSSFPTIQTNFVGPGVSAVAKVMTTFSPHLLNEFVASYTTDHINMSNIGPWQRPAGFTATALFPTNGGKLPGIEVVTTSGLYGGYFSEGPSFIPWNNSNPTYTLRDNAFKNIGKHNLTFGGYFVIAQKNEFAANSIQGLASFNSNSPVSTGNAFADLLIGHIASFQQASAQPKYYLRYKILEPFFQDDWHITRNLTLNLGLRVSLFGTYREKYKQIYNWEQRAWSATDAPSLGPDGELVGGNFYNGLVQCGAPGVPSGCMEGHLFNPAPRIGFAWDPQGDGKTSIRGGYGIFFEHTGAGESNGTLGSAPLVLTPTQYIISGYTSIGGAGLLFPLEVSAIPTKAVWPYMQQWHVDVQREMFRNTILTVGYVGSKGTHLTTPGNLNQLQPLPAALNPFQSGQPITSDECDTLVVNGIDVSDTQAGTHLAIACGADPNPFRNFVGYGNILSLERIANSSYNSFQTTLRRTAGALAMSFAYTWSHSIDDSSDRYDNNFVNSYDIKANRASSNFDQRHVVQASWVYDLPFFNSTGLANKALGGWQFSGIFTAQTGTPFSVSNVTVWDNAGVANGVAGGSRADVVGNPNAEPAGGRFSVDSLGPLLYDPAAFASPTGLTFGNSGRNFLRNPSRWNVDMAVYKVFKVTETAALQFRAEVFNVLNHTQWSGINGFFGAGPTFLRPWGARRARTIQFALKFSF